MKTIDRIDKFLVGCELKSTTWHILHILRMNAVQDEIAIQEAMEEIAEGDYSSDCPHEKRCEGCKFEKAPYTACIYLYTIHKHTGLEPMPHE